MSDKKIAVPSTTNPDLIAYYTADVVTANDYFPFGMIMPGRKYQQVTSSYRYGFNGQEKSTEINDNSYTAEFWQYDARIGRRFNLDPKPNISISPYSAFTNNPIWFSDVKGDTIIIEGGDKFKQNTQQYLLKIAETDKGKIIIDRLKSSTTNYTINEVFFATNSQYDSDNDVLSYDDDPWRSKLDGGALTGMIILAHEIYHAYQDDTGVRPFLDRTTAETQASEFQNYVTSVFGLGAMRTSYTGIGTDIFSEDEKDYNPKNEKITNINIKKNPSQPTSTGDRNDGNTGVKKYPIFQPTGSTVTYEKSYTIDGKEVKQSVKKASEYKIAKEKN